MGILHPGHDPLFCGIVPELNRAQSLESEEPMIVVRLNITLIRTFLTYNKMYKT